MKDKIGLHDVIVSEDVGLEYQAHSVLRLAADAFHHVSRNREERHRI